MALTQTYRCLLRTRHSSFSLLDRQSHNQPAHISLLAPLRRKAYSNHITFALQTKRDGRKSELVNVPEKADVNIDHDTGESDSFQAHILSASRDEGKPEDDLLGRRSEAKESKVDVDEIKEESGNGAVLGGSVALGAVVLGSILGVGLLGFVYKDDINSAVTFFSEYIEGAGPAGYVAFVAGYAALEVLAIPAIPLTMSAGLIFGPATGTILCSISGTIAATAAFLIARYAARERILALVAGNKKFLAIDKAIGEDSFRVVTLLRLSPLLPFSLGNYVYGLTSVKLWPYIFGSWLGMLPGTWAYVSAGAFGRSLLEAEEGQAIFGDSSVLSLAAGVAITAATAFYVGNLAKNAVKDLD